MKMIKAKFMMAGLVILFVVLGVSQLQAQVMISVVQSNATPQSASGKGGKGGSDTSSSQIIQLNITLRSSSRDYTNATVKYYLFATDVKKGEAVLAKKGEKQITLVAMTPEKVQSESVTFTHNFGGTTTPAPAANKGTATHSTASKPTVTPPSGQDYAGYGVQVVLDGKVISESFPDLSLKALIDVQPPSTDAAPPAKPKKTGH